MGSWSLRAYTDQRPSGVELLDARLMTLPTTVVDGVLHYVYGRD